MSDKFTSVHYHTYLQLDKLLGAQELRSASLAKEPAHDEMLFIIMHQVYELWFKQIIHEIGSIGAMFADDQMDDREISIAVNRLERIIEIQKLLIEQVNVMESMTAMDFLDFRHYLFPASGFQSLQFRLVENMLGLKEEDRLTYNKKPYDIVFTGEQKKQLKESVENKSLLTNLIVTTDR